LEKEVETKKFSPEATNFCTASAVFGDALAEALVGHVQEGHQLARLHGGDHLVPLRRGQVVAGRVVAAGVQHDDGAGRRGLSAVSMPSKLMPRLAAS
jgi:hypothetical protein